MPERTFMLNAPIFNGLTKKFGELKCWRCGKKFSEGETIVSKPKCGSRGHLRHYHTQCWESLFVA